MRRRSIEWLFVVCTLCFASRARAERAGCVAEAAPWVRLTLEGPYFAEPLRANVLQHVATDLARRGLAVCEGAGGGSPVAEMRIALARAASLSIELTDDVSGEHFEREVSLAGIPNDALALSIAATAEELLYASLAQNAVAAPHAASSPPSAVAPPEPALPSRAPTSSSPSPLPENDAPAPAPERAASGRSDPGSAAAGATFQVQLLAAADAATQGATGFGGDLGVTWGGRAMIGARTGFRSAPSASSPHGTVGMREGIAGLTGSVALVPRQAAWGGEITVHGDVFYVEFDAAASPPARALGGSGTGVVLRGGLAGWVRIARSWSIVGEASGGAPIRAVTASDAGTAVTGVRGLLIGFAFGVATQL